MKAHFVADTITATNALCEWVCSSNQKALKGELAGNSNWNGKLVELPTKKYLVVPLSIIQVFLEDVGALLDPIEKIIYAALNLVGALFSFKRTSMADAICNLENCFVDLICMPVKLLMSPISLIVKIYQNLLGDSRAQQTQLSMQFYLNGMHSGLQTQSPLESLLAKETKSVHLHETKKRPVWSRICAIPIAICDMTLETVRTLMKVVIAIELTVSVLWKSLAELSAAIVMLPVKLLYQIVTAIKTPGAYMAVSNIKATFNARGPEIERSDDAAMDF